MTLEENVKITINSFLRNKYIHGRVKGVLIQRQTTTLLKSYGNFITKCHVNKYL